MKNKSILLTVVAIIIIICLFQTMKKEAQLNLRIDVDSSMTTIRLQPDTISCNNFQEEAYNEYGISGGDRYNDKDIILVFDMQQIFNEGITSSDVSSVRLSIKDVNVYPWTELRIRHYYSDHSNYYSCMSYNQRIAYLGGQWDTINTITNDASSHKTYSEYSIDITNLVLSHILGGLGRYIYFKLDPDTSDNNPATKYTKSLINGESNSYQPYILVTYDCIDNSWSPDMSTVCSGTSFTQTSNCGTTRNVIGTKLCLVYNDFLQYKSNYLSGSNSFSTFISNTNGWVQ